MEKRKKNRIIEEITANEINSLIRNQIDSNNSSAALKKIIKKTVSDCLSDFTKALYNKKSFWKSDVER